MDMQGVINTINNEIGSNSELIVKLTNKNKALETALQQLTAYHSGAESKAEYTPKRYIKKTGVASKKSRGISSFWAQFSPEQRSKIMTERRKVAAIKKAAKKAQTAA